MDFTIISLGNVEFLSMVLNGVAMICGTGNFARLVAVGFVIGLLFIGLQCIFKGGQQIDLHHTFLCFLCYLCMFGPSCTVVVEDAYTGEVRTVDNLPLGVGVAGAGISGIGYGVTKLMEQGYGAADRTTEHEFAEPLRILNKLRVSGASDEIFRVIDSELGPRANGSPSSSRDALLNYISECTMAKIQLGGTTYQQLYRSGWGDEWKLPSEAHTVLLPISTMGATETVTCDDGFAKVTTMFAKLSSTAVKTAVNRMLKIKDPNGTGVATDSQAIETALGALNASMNGSQDLMQMLVIEGVYNEAARKFYLTQQDVASAIAVNQALIQRNTQWASEGTMFLSTARALMAFIEGFVYAITPIVGFLIAVGAFGVGLVGKYFLTIAWIQLWLPIMSIVNLYTLTGARAAITNASLGASASFYAVDVIWQETQTWIATAGMLIAATPMLALFLVTGSTYAFTTLAGRFGGQDHFNEKINTPDAVAPSAVMNHAPHVMADRNHGVRTMGADAIAPKDNFNQAFDAQVSSRQGVVNAQAQAVTAAVSEAVGDTQSASQVNAFHQNVGHTMSATQNAAAQTEFKAAAQAMRKAGYDESQIQTAMAEVGGALRASAGIGIGTNTDNAGSTGKEEMAKTDQDKVAKLSNPAKFLAGLMGLRADVGVSGDMKAAQKDAVQSGTTHNQSAQRSLGAEQSKRLAAALQSEYSKAVQNMSSGQYQNLANINESSTLGQQFSKMSEARRSYEQAQTFRNSYGSSQSLDRVALSESLLGTTAGDQLAKFESRFAPNSAERGQLTASYNAWRAQNLSPTQARIAAAIGFMNTHQEYQAELGNMLMQSRLPVQDSVAAAKMGSINPDQNKILKGPGNVDDIAGGWNRARDEQNAKIEAGNPGPVDMYKGEENVLSHFKEGKDSVSNRAAFNDGAAMNREKGHALAELINGSQHSTGIDLASNWMRNGFVGTTLKRLQELLTNYGPTVLPNIKEQNLGDYLHNHQRSLDGLSEVQQRYMETYHQYRFKGGTESAPVIEASQAVRQEMRGALYGNKEKLTEQEEKRLDIATTAMINNLQTLHEVDNKGLAAQVHNFNTAYNLKANDWPDVDRVR